MLIFIAHGPEYSTLLKHLNRFGEHSMFVWIPWVIGLYEYRIKHDNANVKIVWHPSYSEFSNGTNIIPVFLMSAPLTSSTWPTNMFRLVNQAYVKTVFERNLPIEKEVWIYSMFKVKLRERSCICWDSWSQTHRSISRATVTVRSGPFNLLRISLVLDNLDFYGLHFEKIESVPCSPETTVLMDSQNETLQPLK